MKNLKLFVFICFSLFFVACSTSSSDAITPVEDSFVPQFEIKINGVTTNYYLNTNIYKFENTFNIGYYPSTLLSFDKSGKFGNFCIELPTSNNNITRKYYSFKGFSSHYFNLNIESVDEVNKRVKGTFSGYIYADPLDLNSETKFVSGSFYQKYEELIPVIFGLKNSAKINGNDWFSVNKYATRSTSDYNKITQHDLYDDEYKIMVSYDLINTTVGTYNFTNSDLTNKIQLAKFDVQTGTFINYNCTGILNITYKYNKIVEGTYNFTAINPVTNEIVPVTNGNFKLVYTNAI